MLLFKYEMLVIVLYFENYLKCQKETIHEKMLFHKFMNETCFKSTVYDHLHDNVF